MYLEPLYIGMKQNHTGYKRDEAKSRRSSAGLHENLLADFGSNKTMMLVFLAVPPVGKSGRNFRFERFFVEGKVSYITYVCVCVLTIPETVICCSVESGSRSVRMVPCSASCSSSGAQATSGRSHHSSVYIPIITHWYFRPYIFNLVG